MPALGKRKAGRSVGPVLFALIAVISCASTAQNLALEPAQEESNFKSEKNSSATDRKENSGTIKTSSDVSSDSGNAEYSDIIPDPLAEVADLWESKRFTEARLRFLKDDVHALSAAERHSEWNLWRGRLFLRQWSGEALGLNGSNISAVLLDSDDVWMGTWTGGVSRLSIPLNRAEVWDAGAPSLAVRTVNSIRRSGNRIHIARYGGVDTFNLRESSWSSIRDLPVGERIQDYLEVEEGIFLASLGNGLWKKNGLQWNRVPEPGLFITRLVETSDGRILVCTMDRGLYIHDVNNNSWTGIPDDIIAGANVTSALTIGSRIIGGTYGKGAFVWDTARSDVSYLDKNLMGSGWVMDLDKVDNRVVFATFGGGLRYWNPDSGDWGSISVSDGLPTADIASLAVGNDGEVWAGTLGAGLVALKAGMFGD